MLTREAIDGIVSRIMDTGGLTEDMSRDVRLLKDELDERDGMLRSYGEMKDRGDGEVQFEDRANADYQTLRSRYDTLYNRYTDSFQNRHSAHETDESFEQVERKTDTDYSLVTIDGLIVSSK